MKQITILGASSMVGQKLLQKAIDRHIHIKVLSCHKEKLQHFTQDIELIEGNYFDKNKLQYILKGSEAILSTIEPIATEQLSTKEEDKYIATLTFIIQQMQTNRQKRWMNISGAGAKLPHENLPFARKLLRVKQFTASKSTINIKDRELQLLEQSNLDWTSVRPPMILEKEAGDFVADERKFIGNTVDLNQLCEFMFSEISKNQWIKKAPVVGTK